MDIVSIFKKEEGKEDNYDLKFQLWKDFMYYQDNRDIRMKFHEAKCKNILTREEISLPHIPLKLTTIRPTCSQ